MSDKHPSTSKHHRRTGAGAQQYHCNGSRIKLGGRAKRRPQIKLTKYSTRDLMIPKRLDLDQTRNENHGTYRNRQIQEVPTAFHNHAESRW